MKTPGQVGSPSPLRDGGSQCQRVKRKRLAPLVSGIELEYLANIYLSEHSLLFMLDIVLRIL